MRPSLASWCRKLPSARLNTALVMVEVKRVNARLKPEMGALETSVDGMGQNGQCGRHVRRLSSEVVMDDLSGDTPSVANA
jgi:hypothetical protein